MLFRRVFNLFLGRGCKTTANGAIDSMGEPDNAGYMNTVEKFSPLARSGGIDGKLSLI